MQKVWLLESLKIKVFRQTCTDRVAENQGFLAYRPTPSFVFLFYIQQMQKMWLLESLKIKVFRQTCTDRVAEIKVFWRTWSH